MKNRHFLFLLLVLASGVGCFSGCQTRQKVRLQSAGLGPAAQTVSAPPPPIDSVRHGGKRYRRPKDHSNLGKLTRQYQQSTTSPVPAQAFNVDRKVLESLLVRECVGVRIYLAKDTLPGTQEYQLILVGVKKNPRPTSENDRFLDLISSSKSAPTLTSSLVVIQTGDRCPVNCDLTSPLSGR